MAIKINKVLITKTNFTWEDAKNHYEDWSDIKDKSNWADVVDNTIHASTVFVNEPITIKVWAEDTNWNTIKSEFTDWNDVKTSFTNWKTVQNYH